MIFASAFHMASPTSLGKRILCQASCDWHWLLLLVILRLKPWRLLDIGVNQARPKDNENIHISGSDNVVFLRSIFVLHFGHQVR